VNPGCWEQPGVLMSSPIAVNDIGENICSV
jgi:hypothetical protein